MSTVTNWLLRAVPKEIAGFVIDEQARLKKERGGCSVSLATTIYSLLRELKECRNINHKIN